MDALLHKLLCQIAQIEWILAQLWHRRLFWLGDKFRTCCRIRCCSCRGVAQPGSAPALGAGGPSELAKQFAGLLWGDLMVSLLLGVAERPNPGDIARRARDAAATFLQLHPLPNEAAKPRAVRRE